MIPNVPLPDGPVLLDGGMRQESLAPVGGDVGALCVRDGADPALPASRDTPGANWGVAPDKESAAALAVGTSTTRPGSGAKKRHERVVAWPLSTTAFISFPPRSIYLAPRRPPWDG